VKVDKVKEVSTLSHFGKLPPTFVNEAIIYSSRKKEE